MLHHGQPADIYLFINYFLSKSAQRQEEIDFCVKTNCESPYFAEVISIGNQKPKHPKLRHKQYYKRPNYRQFIEHCNKYFKGSICVVANIDITFDETINLVHQIDLSNTFVALTRWKNELADCDARDEEVWDRNVHWAWGARKGDTSSKDKPKGSYTQDAWIFKAPLRVNPHLADMTMGYMGCDHKMAKIAKDAGYRLVNPSRSIKAIHWHDSEYRTYDNDARFDVICPIVPCFIEDIT